MTKIQNEPRKKNGGQKKIKYLGNKREIEILKHEKKPNQKRNKTIKKEKTTKTKIENNLPEKNKVVEVIEKHAAEIP